MDILSNPQLLQKAIIAVRKNITYKDKKKIKNATKQLFEEDSGEESRQKVNLVMSLFKLPKIPEDGQTTHMTVKSAIPNSFVDEYTNVLLLTRDLRLGKDFAKTADHFKDLLREHEALELVSEVMPYKQLKNEYKDFEKKRNLAQQFDIVLCDRDIISIVPYHLGKPFYKAKKRPIQINIKSKNLKKTISSALSKSYLQMNLEGTCSMAQIGRINQTTKELMANILATVEGWKKFLPGGWANVRSIHLKSEKSKSIPLYLSYNRKAVGNVVHPYKEKECVIAADELSTYGHEGFNVEITNDLNVRLMPSDPNTRRLVKRKEKLEDLRNKAKYNPAKNKIMKNGRIIKNIGKNKVKKEVNKFYERKEYNPKSSSFNEKWNEMTRSQTFPPKSLVQTRPSKRRNYVHYQPDSVANSKRQRTS